MPNALFETIVYYIQAEDWHRGNQTWTLLWLHGSVKGLSQEPTVDEAHEKQTLTSHALVLYTAN